MESKSFFFLAHLECPTKVVATFFHHAFHSHGPVENGMSPRFVSFDLGNFPLSWVCCGWSTYPLQNVQGLIEPIISEGGYVWGGVRLTSHDYYERKGNQTIPLLGGGFKYLLFSSLPREMIDFD